MRKNQILTTHLKDIWDKLYIIFIPICWITEIYYQFKYKQIISGHEFIQQDDGTLKCDICKKVSK
jgi:hypothetical protein